MQQISCKMVWPASLILKKSPWGKNLKKKIKDVKFEGEELGP